MRDLGETLVISALCSKQPTSTNIAAVTVE